MTAKIGEDASGERRMMGSLREALAAAGRSEGSAASAMSQDAKALPAPPQPSAPPALAREP